MQNVTTFHLAILEIFMHLMRNDQSLRSHITRLSVGVLCKVTEWEVALKRALKWNIL